MERFSALHKLSSRLGMAVNCAKFVEAAHVGAEGSERVYDLLLRVLTLLNADDSVPENLPLYFRGRLTAEYGYRPEFGRCTSCGTAAAESDRVAFSLSRGAFTCAACGFLPDADVLPGAALSHLDRLLKEDPAEWGPAVQSEERTVRQACLILERFVEYHMDLVWDAGRFRRQKTDDR